VNESVRSKRDELARSRLKFVLFGKLSCKSDKDGFKVASCIILERVKRENVTRKAKRRKSLGSKLKDGEIEKPGERRPVKSSSRRRIQS
jgi:hypothetical protein